MITLTNIQEKLAEAIRQSGMTQTEIAKLLHVKPTQICSYIHGRKMPALDTLANLCVILDVDANDILCINTEDSNAYKNYINNSFNNSNNSGTFNF